MARITVEDCLQRENNRFALVQLAAKRAKQLLEGAPVLIEDRRENKSIVTSLREIAASKVRFMTPEEEAIALEEAAKREEEARKAPRPEAARPAVLEQLAQMASQAERIEAQQDAEAEASADDDEDEDDSSDDEGEGDAKNGHHAEEE